MFGGVANDPHPMSFLACVAGHVTMSMTLGCWSCNKEYDLVLLVM